MQNPALYTALHCTQSVMHYSGSHDRALNHPVYCAFRHYRPRIVQTPMSRPDTDHFRQLFLNDTPLMDVRAPVEYARGSFPNARNAPLMNDDERHRVGICYKENGQEAA